MMKKKLFGILLFLCIYMPTANAAIFTSPAFQSQLNHMFGGAMNVTDAQVYQGQLADSMSGGSLVVRNKIMSASIIGFVPPHVSAGCGGIDMFGGSFSFINATQFTNLLRAVASNAQGYFFQLALQAMCSQCSNLMSGLQSKIEKLNSMLGNSCQIGKTVVNAAASAIPQSMLSSSPNSSVSKVIKQAQSDFATTTSTFKDTLSSSFPTNNTGPIASELGVDPTGANLAAKGVTGNILWEQMKAQNVDGWFAAGESSRSAREIIMSFLGTIIVDANGVVNKPTGGTEKGLSSNDKEASIELRDLVDGNAAASVWVCEAPSGGNDPCMKPVLVGKTNIVGINQKVNAILFGNMTGQPNLPNTGSIGILQKAIIKVGQHYSLDEQKFVSSIPQPILAMVNSLASSADPNSANQLARTLTPYISLTLVSSLVDQYIEMAKTVVSQTKGAKEARATDFLKLLGARQLVLQRAVRAYSSQLKNVSGAIAQYNQLRQAIRKNLAVEDVPMTNIGTN